MNIIADLHSHTLVSQHAYSTLQEMCSRAAELGLKALAITDHAPQMPDAANMWHFGNMNIFPRQIYGVTVLRGVELNVLNYDGTVDIEQEQLKRKIFEIVIASLHHYSIEPATSKEHTCTYQILCENPYIDILGHPLDPHFPSDLRAIARCAARNGKALELNESMLRVKPELKDKYKQLLFSCAEENALVSVSSDAHISFEVGDFSAVMPLIEEVGFPSSLIINSSVENLNRFLKDRNKDVPEIK